jgi:GT2 family glycosyltransferase
VSAPLTVAVATLGRPEGLERCLRALLDGDEAPAQIVVVDQGADREGEEVVRRLDPAIVYVASGERGLSRSRNAAIAAATEDIVAITDDDCVPDPGWVASIARTFAGDASLAAVTGPVLPLGPATADTAPVSSRVVAEARTWRGAVAPWHAGTGGNMALRRSWIERIGPFDPRLGAGTPAEAAEDVDYLYRLLRAGAAIRAEPAAIVRHERAPLSRRWRTRRTYGRGIGAFVALHLARRDWGALRVLVQWKLMRLRLLLRGAARLRWRTVAEELLVLAATFEGLAVGARTARGRA